MAQLMPLPLIVSCFSKIQIGFAFLVPAHLDSPRQRAIKQVSVCVCVQWRLGSNQARTCSSSAGVKSFFMLNVLRISSGVLPLIMLATVLHVTSSRPFMSR